MDTLGRRLTQWADSNGGFRCNYSSNDLGICFQTKQMQVGWIWEECLVSHRLSTFLTVPLHQNTTRILLNLFDGYENFIKSKQTGTFFIRIAQDPPGVG
jgi:hypothetical protein